VLTVSGLKPDTARQGAAYNLSIQGIHTYHVGDNEILVHNMCPTGGAANSASHIPVESQEVIQSIRSDGVIIQSGVKGPAVPKEFRNDSAQLKLRL
jgi:hypothetical protein